jgi:hypothetical protein
MILKIYKNQKPMKKNKKILTKLKSTNALHVNITYILNALINGFQWVKIFAQCVNKYGKTILFKIYWVVNIYNYELLKINYILIFLIFLNREENNNCLIPLLIQEFFY